MRTAEFIDSARALPWVRKIELVIATNAHTYLLINAGKRNGNIAAEIDIEETMTFSTNFDNWNKLKIAEKRILYGLIDEYARTELLDRR
ncbi:hypothetical protein EQG49_12690 [Periweissella cryptocerci]|uniref:Uncharacterized protein n=1 Tax=Periweissella cryptocerci TaxID=2506420 RepID=A0A4V1AIZ8_9LACO|nr:hypothetical protein [Periweissella cryptocerci]QBO37255.1 hypothetical protein EQG49_12690 [Periweissella cryptocerci]